MKGQLTQRMVETAGPGRHADKAGTGLLLVVGKNGSSRSWIQRTMIRGRQVDIGLGSCRRVKLSRARTLAFENWMVARDGGDPRRPVETVAVTTFAAALDAVLANEAPNWRGGGGGGRSSSAKRRFCTENLKIKPIREHVYAPIWRAGRTLISWQGIRRDESAARLRAKRWEPWRYRQTDGPT